MKFKDIVRILRGYDELGFNLDYYKKAKSDALVGIRGSLRCSRIEALFDFDIDDVSHVVLRGTQYYPLIDQQNWIMDSLSEASEKTGVSYTLVDVDPSQQRDDVRGLFTFQTSLSEGNKTLMQGIREISSAQDVVLGFFAINYKEEKRARVMSKDTQVKTDPYNFGAKSLTDLGFMTKKRYLIKLCRDRSELSWQKIVRRVNDAFPETRVLSVRPAQRHYEEWTGQKKEPGKTTEKKRFIVRRKTSFGIQRLEEFVASLLKKTNLGWKDITQRVGDIYFSIDEKRLRERYYGWVREVRRATRGLKDDGVQPKIPYDNEKKLVGRKKIFERDYIIALAKNRPELTWKEIRDLVAEKFPNRHRDHAVLRVKYIEWTGKTKSKAKRRRKND